MCVWTTDIKVNQRLAVGAQARPLTQLFGVDSPGFKLEPTLSRQKESSALDRSATLGNKNKTKFYIGNKSWRILKGTKQKDRSLDQYVLSC